VRDGDIYGWEFAGLEGEVDIRQIDGTIEGFLDMNAFMLERGWLTSEEALMRAVFDREGIEFESLVLRMGDSTLVDGIGRLEYAGDRIRLSTDNLNLVYRDLEVSVPVLSSELDWEKKEFEIEDLRMEIGGGSISVQGEMAYPQSVEFNGEVHSVRLDALDALVPNGYGIDGLVDLKVNVTNSLVDPEIELSGSLRNPVIKGTWADSILARANYADSRLRVERASIDGGGHKVGVVASLPIEVDLYPFRVEGIATEEVDVRIDLDAFPLPALRILTDEVDFIEGVVEGDIRLGGKLGNPSWEGNGRVRNGEGVVNLTNTYFNRMGMNVSFEGDRIEVSDISAWLMGEGDLAGLGTIWMNGIYPDSVEFALVAEDYMVNQIRHVSTLIFDSDLTVTGKIEHPEITGDVVIQHGVLDIPVSTNETVRDEGEPVPYELLLDVVAENDLWIRSSDMNVEISLDIDMITREGKIKPVGDLDVIRGTYTYFGTIFDIREGEINFFGSHPIDPALNVLTTRTIRGRVFDEGGSRQVNNEFHLTIYGTYRDVEFDIVVYDANGEVIPIDRQKAMTLLLANMTNEEFDQQAAPNQQRVIGQIEGILAQQTSSLIQPVSKLDVLELRTNLFSGDAETGRAQVTVGEYLMEDFFVSYSQDILDPSINNIAVEVYLGRKSSVVGQTDSKGRQYSVELRYRMSY
jgi:autotransporter translocation and assembly factor TamB